MNIPNFLTVLRIILVPIIVWLLVNNHGKEASWFFVLTALTDFLDGFIAKNCNLETELGRLLDPLSDKLLLLSCFITFAWIGIMPLWFVLVAVVRDIMIVGGAFLYKKTTKKLYISPPFYGKTNTALQMLLLVVIFFNNGYGIEINEYYLLLITAFSTIVSGAMYVAEWGKKGYKLIYQ